MALSGMETVHTAVHEAVFSATPHITVPVAVDGTDYPRSVDHKTANR